MFKMESLEVLDSCLLRLFIFLIQPISHIFLVFSWRRQEGQVVQR